MEPERRGECGLSLGQRLQVLALAKEYFPSLQSLRALFPFENRPAAQLTQLIFCTSENFPAAQSLQSDFDVAPFVFNAFPAEQVVQFAVVRFLFEYLPSGHNSQKF